MELNKDLYIDGVSDYLEGGKNIFDKGSLYTYTPIIQQVTLTEQDTGVKIEYTSTEQNTGYILYNLGLASKYAGKPITCSADVVLNSNTTIGRITIGLISNDGTTTSVLKVGQDITSNTNGYSVSATIPSTISSNTPYLGMYLYVKSIASGNKSIEYKNLQAEEGLGATPYEPHKKYITKQYLEQQENLYNSSTDTLNYIINSEGELVSASTWRVTDYIPVTPGSTFYYEGLINTGVAPMSAFYNSSKQFVSSFKQGKGINNIVVPSGVSYIRFSLNNSDINIFKYDNRSYYGKYVTEDYLTNGKNKANIPTHTVAGQGTDYRIVDIEENTTYTLSCVKSRISGVTITNGSLIMFVKFDFYNGSTKISSASLPSAVSFTTGSKYLTYTFTTPANCDNILLNLGNNNGDNNRNTSVSDVMLNKGPTALPYEEYYEKYLNKGDGILIPYTLYYNSSGSTGNITLSDNVENYKYIEIYYKDETNAILCQKTYSSPTILSISRFSSDGANWQPSRTIELSQNTITTTRYGRITITSSGSVSVSSSNNIYITRVIGYK